MNALFRAQHDQPSAHDIGGKGHNLCRLQEEHKVPDWIGIPASIFINHLTSHGLDQTIQSKLETLTEEASASIADEITNLIRNIPLQNALTSELEKTVTDIFGSDYVSVRSSAIDEDGSNLSFAGIHESFLYVRGLPEIEKRIRDVWASGYQERALLYRLRNNLCLHPVPMAVLIQRMVNAKTSGVVFTGDPSIQDPCRMVISALYGLGEGLVSAGLEADTFSYDKRTKKFTEALVTKSSSYVLDTKHGSGLKEIPVEQVLQDKSSLTNEQLCLLATTALKIERMYGRPQDIEFCFDEAGQLYLLQTRAITTMDEYGPAAGNQQIWDNSNIIESYSGVTSPMTFSFIRHAYSVVYTCFSEVMGISPAIVRENQTVYRNMLGLFDGQVYYNLPNWYRLVKQFPGYAYNKAFMESMMGVKTTIDPESSTQPHTSIFRRYCIELPKLIHLASRMLYKFSCLRRLVPDFNAHFERYYNQWAAMDFKQMQPHELMHVYSDMEKHVLRNWKTPIINDFHVMVFYGILKACCKAWCKDEKGSLQNNLICGEGEIESTRPTRMLMKLAASIKTDTTLTNLFLTHEPIELLRLIPRREDTQHIAQAITEYLRLYGFRCVNELKLEEPSLHETPEFVYQMIANYVRMDETLLDLSAQDAREKSVRSEAEEKAFSRLSPVRRVIFRLILRHAREGVKNRENMRFARTKIYGLLRLLLQAIGHTFSREGIIDTPHDIFYLTVDEIWDYIKGTAVTRDLRALVALRKKEFDGYRSQPYPPDDHFETYGMAYHRNRFRNATQNTSKTNATTDFLHGIGCSPGIVEGQVRIIHSPRSDARLNGEILAAARTDPGWVPLYPSISGLLIERGSILSHSAIVAREIGLPTIVGIPNLLKTLHGGQRVHMDASTGIVSLLD